MRFFGPIPARTGQPYQRQNLSRCPGAYPRSHGATAEISTNWALNWGLSPLARGNHQGRGGYGGRSGPIPARTGQPRRRRLVHPWCRAYPRSHGATSSTFMADSTCTGLSPLARGNPTSTQRRYHSSGPIPARTGQPTRANRLACIQRAYPRSHGATIRRQAAQAMAVGLSPLARGNPSAPPAAQFLAGAYPRSHGATSKEPLMRFPHWGLSPLARGNLTEIAVMSGAEGPIPARTGQPQDRQPQSCASWAYPRSHGATTSLKPGKPSGLGLSPLARGNPAVVRAVSWGVGPIPARTGQPAFQHAHTAALKAYPRSHGATSGRLMILRYRSGLSPLARGNLK